MTIHHRTTLQVELVKLLFELLKSDLTFIPEADKQFEPCTEACACSIKPLYSRAGYGTLSFML